ncbi:CsbD family protein [Novosphingobium sp.]|uniref:CsbD family protein n=1 Tax=Novosphingobium sp. TaxID=1874826 RepID=UPI002FE1889A
MNKDQIEGNWKIIYGRIQRLWAESLEDHKGELRANLQEITGHLQKEFGLAREEAEDSLRRWQKEFEPRAWVDAQWTRFSEAMRDRWSDLQIDANATAVQLEERRERVVRDAEELIDCLKQRYRLSEDAAAQQINDWLARVRTWFEERERQGDDQ